MLDYPSIDVCPNTKRIKPRQPIELTFLGFIELYPNAHEAYVRDLWIAFKRVVCDMISVA